MNTYWWFRPSRIALLIVMPLLFAAFTADDRFYQRFGAFNAITGDRFFFGWLSIMAFAAASWVGEVVVPNRPQASARRISEATYRMPELGLALVAVLATCIFLAPFVSHPDIVLGVIRGEQGASDTVRNYSDSIRGITSQENLSALVVVLFMLKLRLTGYRRTKFENLVLIGILCLTAVKVVLNSERVALIEIVLPLCLLYCGLRRRRSTFWSLAPITGIGGLFLFFASTEYLRSWASFYATQEDSLIQFALYRLIGYYMTALNNGAYVYGEGHAYIFPVFTAPWLWRLPIPGLADWLSAVSGATTDVPALLAGQNVEFNNTSGLFAPLVDFGPVFGVAVWGVLGSFSGHLYRLFVEGRLLGLILFPTWYVGVLEIPRIFLWGDSRYFPPLVVSLALTATFGSLTRDGQRKRFGHGEALRREGWAGLSAQAPGELGRLRPRSQAEPQKPGGETAIRPVIICLFTVGSVALGGAACAEAGRSVEAADRTVSIVDFGARADGRSDSTAAIIAAVNEARFRGVGVSVPGGTFVHRHFSLDGVAMTGSGPQSVLLAPNPEDSTIFLRHSRAALLNLTVKVRSSHRDSLNHAIWIDHANQFVIDSVTVEGSNAAGIFDFGGSDGRISRNTIRDTLADAIHNTDGARDILITGNVVRHSGDDMIAVVSYAKDDALCDNIRIEHNDLADQDWGRGIAVSGGRDVTIWSNNVARTNCCAGIYLSSEAAWKTRSVRNVIVRDNVLTDNSGRTRHGAIMLFANYGSVRNILLEGNTIIHSRHAAIRLVGAVSDVALIDNHISDPTGGGVSGEGPAICGAGNTLDGAPVAMVVCRGEADATVTGSSRGFGVSGAP